MLKINVEQLNEGPQTLEFDLRPEEIELQDELYSFTGRVKGEIEFRLVNHDVLALGELTAQATTPCARCLEPARVTITVPVHEMWLKRQESDVARGQPVPDDETLAEFYEGEEIDLKEPLRELVMAELPGIAYCRTDCKGLCPGCGANLNREKCRCAKKSVVKAGDAEPDWKRALRGISKKK